MGQYYLIVNIDKKEYLKPDFLKLMETSYLGNPYPETVVDLLSKKWKNDRVMWCGDYAENEPYFKDILETYNREELEDLILSKIRDLKHFYETFGSISNYIDNAFNYYSLAKYCFKQIKPIYSNDDLITRRDQTVFILNEDKKEVIEIRYYVHFGVLDYIIHPLPLLTATSNGLGGGDYDGTNMNYVGSWAGDRLSSKIVNYTERENEIKNLLKNGYKILVIEFNERTGI